MSVNLEQIGRYQVVRKLGKGGMGAVYKALVPVIDKVVAVKILDPFEVMEDLLGYESLKEIFIFEANTMAGLHHPAVVDVWDFDEDAQGRPFFVMEFFCNNLGEMIGENFQVEKKSRRIQPDKVLDYGRQLLDGLAFLHDNRIIHRDIKPFNILITDEDRVKICDFGMALVQNVSFSGPDTMQVGSPFYAAPEQIKSPNSVDGRADLYSAGVLLYRMLTGELPSMRSFSLSMINPLFDAAWDDFFSKAINLQPDFRFQSAQDMLEELRHLHLHWQDVKRQNSAIQPVVVAETGLSLRKEAANVCGSRALTLFGLNEISRPQKAIVNDFIQEEEGIILDRATDLVWQAGSSEYALSFGDAQKYISNMNAQQYAGRKSWRLPTVNEIFSLYNEKDWDSPHPSRSPRHNWLWSCDQHGKRDAWYVNLELGYADWQDVSCRYFVKAVCN